MDLFLFVKSPSLKFQTTSDSLEKVQGEIHVRQLGINNLVNDRLLVFVRRMNTVFFLTLLYLAITTAGIFYSIDL